MPIIAMCAPVTNDSGTANSVATPESETASIVLVSDERGRLQTSLDARDVEIVRLQALLGAQSTPTLSAAPAPKPTSAPATISPVASVVETAEATVAAPTNSDSLNPQAPLVQFPFRARVEAFIPVAGAVAIVLFLLLTIDAAAFLAGGSLTVPAFIVGSSSGTAVASVHSDTYALVPSGTEMAQASARHVYSRFLDTRARHAAFN